MRVHSLHEGVICARRETLCYGKKSVLLAKAEVSYSALLREPRLQWRKLDITKARARPVIWKS